MDALKMLKTAKRCCKSVQSCSNCPICNDGVGSGICLFQSAPERLDLERMAFSVSVIESWEREHPDKTRGELFFERNPDAAKSVLGLPLVRPCDYIVDVITSEQCEAYDNCAECIEKFWKESVE